MSDTQHEQPVTSERRTVELCGDELRRGIRCVLSRGHGGEHECQSLDGTDPITWQTRAR